MDHSQHSPKSSETNTDSSRESDPCTDHLTNLDYLRHMIPHHQVAIDMSTMLEPKTDDPVMLHLCRDIKRKQAYEIWEMHLFLKNISDTLFKSGYSIKEDRDTKLDIYYPALSVAENGVCDPAFFNPDDHSKHMETMKLTEESYLRHMIPHHQVAIDMSKRLLMHTNHSYLMDFCRKLIIDQQGEIFYMNNLLHKNNYTYDSELLSNATMEEYTLIY